MISENKQIQYTPTIQKPTIFNMQITPKERMTLIYQPRKTSGPKKDEVSEQFRILHNEALRDLYRSLSIVRIVTCGRLHGLGMWLEWGRQ
jgi:hypothetical protein